MTGRFTRRIGWGVSDQALSSLSNFAIGIAAARFLDLRGLGAFAIVLSAYTILLGASRALGSEPFVVRYSTAGADRWRAGVAVSAGIALSVGILAGAVLVVVGLVLGGRVGAPLVILGLGSPGLLVQDAWRFAFFAHGRERHAFVIDAIWVVVLAPALVVAKIIGSVSPGELAGIWAVGASIGVIWASLTTGIAPKPLAALDWLREQRDLAPRYLGEFAALNGGVTLTTWSVGLIAGLDAVGAIRAALLLLGPLTLLFMSFGLIAVPEGARILASDAGRLRHVTVRLSLWLGGAVVVWTGTLVLITAAVGDSLLGAAWHPARSAVIPLGVSMLGSGLSVAAANGIRSLAAAKRGLRTRVSAAMLEISGGTTGAAVAGVHGAAWGLAVAFLIASILWWSQFLIALDQRIRAAPLMTNAAKGRLREA